MAKHDYGRALIQFWNAVKTDPSDAESRFQLGAAYLENGNIQEAVESLGKALTLDPSHVRARVKLAGLIAGQEGEQTLRGVLTTSPDSLEALNALARIEIQLGKPDDAEHCLRQAMERFPNDLQASVGMARLKLSQRDWAGAEQILRKAALSAPRSADAAIALAELYLMGGRPADARQWFEKALALDENSAPALLGLGAAQLAAGQKDQAGATYVRVSKLPGKQYKHLHASFLFQQGMRDAAISEFERLAKADPGSREARNRLLAAYLLTQRFAEAGKIVETTLRDNPDDADALLMKIQIYLRTGQTGQAEVALREVLHHKPESAEAHYLLSMVYRERGDGLRQRGELGEVLARNPGLLEARIELVRSLLAASSAKSALEVLRETPPEQSGSIAVILQRNWAYYALGDKKALAEGIRQGLSVSQTPELLLQTGLLKILDKDYRSAMAALQDAVHQNPEDPRTVEALALSYLEQKQTMAAIQMIRDHARAWQKSAALQQFVGEWMLERGLRADARAAFAAAAGADPALSAPRLALAQLDAADGKLEEARKTLEAVALRGRGATAARMLLADLEVDAGRLPAAADQYRKILETDANNVKALNNLAYILVDTDNQPDHALEYAQRAKELASSNPDVEGTLGWIFYRKGLYPLARTHLEVAVKRDRSASDRWSVENAALRKYHLAMTYAKLHESKRAAQMLEAAMKINATLPEAKAASQVLKASASF
ncbi:MAG: tetratricopeptide repeat protein [Candidatus Solibacter usitatus]|nr:tetratricopeptide repeat protein [Candidatus Solibacter usitatus]